MSGTQGIERSEIDDLMMMQTALGLLNELNEEDVDWIFRTGFERQVTANTVIVREDEPLAYLYIVLEGLFGVRVASIPDSEIGRLGPGEIIGEISFLENILPSASVVAIESSLLLEIPQRLSCGKTKGHSFIWSTVLPGTRHPQFSARQRTCQFIDDFVPREAGRHKFESEKRRKPSSPGSSASNLFSSGPMEKL